MGTASTSAADNTANLHKSHFQQTVCLVDWWLVKAENDVQGRRLAVGGLTDWGKQAMRVFTSAPILKRCDVFTVETTDGICVVLSGFINKDRTLENGFPSDVFNYFVFGFPPYWKEYEEHFVAKEHPSKSGRQKSKRLKSSTDPSLEKCSGSDLQKESYCNEDHTAPEPPVNGLKNEMKSSSDTNFGGSIKVPAALDKHADDSQVCDRGGTLFACDLNSKRTKEAADNLRKMERAKKTTNFNSGMGTPEIIVSLSEVRVTTRSVSNSKMKKRDDKKPAGLSDDEKIPLDSNSSISYEKVKLEAVFDRETRSRNKDKGIREIKPKSKIEKVTKLPCTPAASTKSRRTPAAANNQRDSTSTGKGSLSKKAKASDMETNRKSAPVNKGTPEHVKEKVQSASPESFSFNRSRSGRLLMPTLEFWRNQRAIYTADRTITGIEEGMQPQQLRNEGGSTPHGERK